MDYYRWLIAKIGYGPGYSKLLRYLYSVIFTVTMPMDQNRAQDGVDLRWNYKTECIVSQADIPDGPCTVLEMMIGLANRIENDFMGIPAENRTAQWFIMMLYNLGLHIDDDNNFDQGHVDHVLLTFFTRSYEPDGKGSLFHVPNTNTDMRQLQIWDQANMWLVYIENQQGGYVL